MALGSRVTGRANRWSFWMYNIRKVGQKTLIGMGYKLVAGLVGSSHIHNDINTPTAQLLGSSNKRNTGN
jgi:hypothetical protein